MDDQDNDNAPVDLPWYGDERKYYTDPEIARSKALKNAKYTAVDPKSNVVQKWATSALNAEIERLRAATSGHQGGYGRNNQLFLSAANLFEIVAAGALDESRVEQELRDACHYNGLTADDGQKSVNSTLESARRKGFDSPRDLSVVGKSTNYQFPDAPTKVQEIDLHTELVRMERGFWTERASLQQIYLAALSGMCAPWAVLGHCVARVLALVPPTVVLPPIIGGGMGGSLNWFCALAAKSGGGKDSSASIAADLVEPDRIGMEPSIIKRGLGSGEGLIEAYRRPTPKGATEDPGFFESIMFAADEIDTVAALSQRSGSTLMGLLRTAFSGARLDLGYRRQNGLVPVEAHTYRMTLTVSVQPGRAGALLDDVYGGTLQRFMWFPAADKRVTDELPDRPGPLYIPRRGEFKKGKLEIPYVATKMIIDEAVKRHHGVADDIEGHALFIREKFAYALAVLDGRADKITDDDWRLAGIASRVSQLTRNWVTQELEKALRGEDTKVGSRRGRQSAAADQAKAEVNQERSARLVNKIRTKIAEGGREGVTQRDLTRALGRDLNLLPEILAELELRGEVEAVQGKRGGNRWKSCGITL